MSKYQPDQQIDVVVEKIFPFGVFVRLEDGTPAYIRRRELALDRDVDPAQIVQEGQRISAAILLPEWGGKLLELSRRRTLDDPWDAFARQFDVGDSVRGTVRTVAPHGIYVRVQAGIDGYVPLDEIAPWKIDKPELILWKEDAIEATIIGMDIGNKQLILSIKARFQEFERALDTFERMPYLESSSNLTTEANATGRQISPDLLNEFQPFLVVDDQEEVRISLANWLEDLGLEVSQASSLAEAKALLQTRNYQVIFVDINLGDADGLELVRSYGRPGNKPEICVMSSLESLHNRDKEIKRAGITRVFSKPLDIDEIENFLLEMVFQKLPFHPSPDTFQALSEETKVHVPFRELQGLEPLEGDPLNRLRTVLAQLTESLHASLGVIFSMDDLSRAITILAHAGLLPIRAEAIYQLEDSPVKDVMVKKQPIFETQMSVSNRARFRKLLDLVSFEACIGAPIQVHGDERYAVFFFHHESGGFSRFRLRDAEAGTWLLAALLEENTLNQRLNTLQPILLSGQLTASFGHEVSNKMIGIELKARKLATPRVGPPQFETETADLLKAILDLKELVGSFQELMWRPETQEFFEVNTCVNLTKIILKPVMRRDKVKLDTHLASDLPPVFGNRNAIQQVFLNLMLNAIQQMNLMQKHPEWEGHKHLEIRTSLSRNGERIYVQFRDTGPGIHRRLWEKIYVPGFSTRGGSGLGLYIARSILYSFGGNILVEESVIPLGTTFRIELPVIRQGNAK